MVDTENRTSRAICRGRPIWVVGILMVLVAGCTEPTRLTVAGTARAAATRALWESGKDRHFHSLGAFTAQVWKDVGHIDKPKAVLTYRVEEFFNTVYGRDVVRVMTEADAVSLSLMCKRKDVAFNFLWGVLCPYRRALGLERSILFGTALKLRETGASVSWEGSWKPLNMPVVVTSDGGLWIAYTNAPPSVATEYLRKNRYEADGSSGDTKLCFCRSLDRDPDAYDDLLLIPLVLEGWDSHERVLLSLIRPGVPPQQGGPIVVIGAWGVGTQHTYQAGIPVTIDVGPMLRTRIVNSIATAAALDFKDVLFVDPSPWIEPVKPRAVE